jgi:uncharacterized protein (TIGR02246 family)
MKTVTWTGALLAALFGFAALGRAAQDDRPEDEAAIRKNSEAYAAAFNKGDLEGIKALWTEDAEYVSGDGERVKGRDAIAALFKRFISENPGAKMRIIVRSIRSLGPDVAMEEGAAEVRSPNEEPESSDYEAINVKRDGKWLLARVRDLDPSQTEDAPGVPASERLAALDWMLGDWRSTAGSTTVEARCRRGEGNSFLLWWYLVNIDGQELMTITQRIGWDPVHSQFHSWLFDSAGGYAEGDWDDAPDGWSVRMAGVTPGGKTASSVHTWIQTDDHTLRWTNRNRRVAGETLPDQDVTFTRTAAP